MKNLIITSIILAASFAVGRAQTADFRGFNWSNSLNQVQTSEKAMLLKKVSDDELVYKDNLGNSDCDVVYIFNDNDKLESGLYIFTKKYSNPELYVQDYKKFKALLTEKYGKPESEGENWMRNAPTYEKHNYGQYVADGSLQLNAVWTTDRTVIKITLVSINQQPNLQIHYTTRSLNELENKEDLKEAIEKL